MASEILFRSRRDSSKLRQSYRQVFKLKVFYRSLTLIERLLNLNFTVIFFI